jgi:SAM-dependent methyltransferase
MPAKFRQDRIRIAGQNISYYNEIAANYDNILARENANKLVRRNVAERFMEKIGKGTIMDFGGGTGLDLEWMTGAGYKIIFCEPSAGMRQVARDYNNKYLHYDQIQFFDDGQTDFTKWLQHPPCSGQADAVLANFAVLNNIPDIRLLFQSMAVILKPGSYLFALILDRSFKKTVHPSFLSKLKASVLGKPLVFETHYGESKQTVFLYSLGQIRKASDAYFDFAGSESFYESGFTLIELVRK